ncbi:MAG: winged helix-turn-helix domain-containing protein [Planctomycetota bacterium]
MPPPARARLAGAGPDADGARRPGGRRRRARRRGGRLPLQAVRVRRALRPPARPAAPRGRGRAGPPCGTGPGARPRRLPCPARRGGGPAQRPRARGLRAPVPPPGEVQSKARIAAAVWDDEIGPDSNVLEVVVSSLRRKLDRDRDEPLLRTRRGLGYVFGPEGDR